MDILTWKVMTAVAPMLITPGGLPGPLMAVATEYGMFVPPRSGTLTPFNVVVLVT